MCVCIYKHTCAYTYEIVYMSIDVENDAYPYIPV